MQTRIQCDFISRVKIPLRKRLQSHCFSILKNLSFQLPCVIYKFFAFEIVKQLRCNNTCFKTMAWINFLRDNRTQRQFILLIIQIILWHAVITMVQFLFSISFPRSCSNKSSTQITFWESVE